MCVWALTRRHNFGQNEQVCSCLLCDTRWLHRNRGNAFAHRRQVDCASDRLAIIWRTQALQRTASKARRHITAHAHADLEGAGAGRARNSNDVPDDSTSRGLRVDSARTKVGVTTAVAIRVGRSAPSADARGEAAVSNKAKEGNESAPVTTNREGSQTGLLLFVTRDEKAGLLGSFRRLLN
jgi:hypothetical protein